MMSGSHSRTSSRSSTPAPSIKDEEGGGSVGRSRRSSTASQASRKKRTSSNLTPSGSTSSPVLRELRPAPSASSLSAGASASDKEESRGATPERVRRELAAKSSFTSEGSVESVDGEMKDKEASSSERMKPRETEDGKT